MLSHYGGTVRMCRLLCGRVGKGSSFTPHTRPVSQHPSSTADPNPTPDATLEAEDVIERKRNKSRLNKKHYRRVHQLPQPLTEDEEVLESLKKQRFLYSLYGAASGISVAKLWPSKEELALEKEWESVAHPHSIHEMIAMAKKARQDEESALRQKQEDISLKMAKLGQWKADVRNRVAKQNQLAQEAKEKKEQLMEEVRQIFGFRIDPRDERFKEALEQKEKEEKKKFKAAKKLAKQQRALEQLKKEAEAGIQAGEEADNQAGGDGKSLSGTTIA